MPTSSGFNNFGTISGRGAINAADADMLSGGCIDPGDSIGAGTVQVSGNLRLTNESGVALDLGLAGGYDRLSVSGEITLDGELFIRSHGTPTGSYAPMQWSESQGAFDAIHGLNVSDGAGTMVLDPIFAPFGLYLSTRAATALNAGASFLDAGNANDYLVGNGDNVVHLGGGADVFIGGGPGSNIVGIKDDDFHFIDGGAGGGNLLRWENIDPAKILDMTQVQTNALQNFDILDLGQDGDVIIDWKHVSSMTNGTNALTGHAGELVVIGGSGASVNFADQGWLVTGQVNLVVDAQQESYTQYSRNETNVLVADNVVHP